MHAAEVGNGRPMRAAEVGAPSGVLDGRIS
jgi:hypothetical protein